TVLGVAALAAVGLVFGTGPAPGAAAPPAPSAPGLGLAMVFVLLTFGGWNEAAYVSAEVRGGSRNLVRALLISIAVITTLYLLLNLALLRGLGREALARTEAPADALMHGLFGPTGAAL